MTDSANVAGQYQVQVRNAAGCLSQRSAVFNVFLSSPATVQFALPELDPLINSVTTYTVQASDDVTSYVWSIAGDAVFLDGTGANTKNSTTTTKSIRVKTGSTVGPIAIRLLEVIVFEYSLQNSSI